MQIFQNSHAVLKQTQAKVPPDSYTHSNINPHKRKYKVTLSNTTVSVKTNNANGKAGKQGLKTKEILES